MSDGEAVGRRFGVPDDVLQAFAERWRLAEVSLFGSVLREDFGPTSDIDVLIATQPGVVLSFADFLNLQAELQALCGRAVDVVDRSAVAASHNWLRRAEILGSSRLVYAA